MEGRPHKARVRRLVAAALLAAVFFGLGYAAGHALDRPPEAPPPEGMELWRTLPPEQLANVAEGLMERISELQDDLDKVREMQQENMAYLHD